MKNLFLFLLLWTSGAAAANLDWAGDAKNTADNGILAPAQDLIVVVDSTPRGAATGAKVTYSTEGGTCWKSRAMEHHGFANYDTRDRWKLNLGRFSEGATVQYSIEVAGSNQTLRLEPFTVTVGNSAAAIRWIGHLRTDPESGALDPGADLRVFSEMKPSGVAVAAEVGVSTNDGASWKTVPMSRGDPADESDVWSANLGGFPEGASVRYFIRARNANGESFWDNNTGANYLIRVNSPIRDVATAKGRYNPGETAVIAVDLRNPGEAIAGTLVVRVMDLAEEIQIFRRAVSLPKGSRQRAGFPWRTPTNDFRGYGVDVDLLVDGQVRDSRSTAIDVSSDWTRFPRMGFFSEYPEGDDAQGKAAELAKFHLNAVQFYDWKWTHDRLVPYGEAGTPADVFTQVSGRVQSFATVRAKVAAVHARNMAALSYNLTYGDSGNAAPEHIEWAAFKVPNSTNLWDIRQHDAGTYKIWVMDVSNPGWKQHIFGQFADAMDQAGFDGIHLDNLGGAWSYKFNSDNGIPEREEFPRFINAARASLRAGHPDARLTHNDVMGNYLAEIARSDADVYYSEVWTRDTYRDLRDNIREARAAGNGKPVVLAAYINRKPWDEMGDPAQPPLPTYINDASAKLLDACIFANGGFHIELGEDGQMLVNEYFPARTPRMHAGLKQSMRDYCDFAVRYENLLCFDPRAAVRDGADDLRISSATHALSNQGDRDAIWTMAKIRDDGILALSLVNLIGVDSLWRNPSGNPTPQTHIALKVRTDRKIRRVLVASPDVEPGRMQELPFQTVTNDAGVFISFAVPRLTFWNLVVIQP
jgi:dextranase